MKTTTQLNIVKRLCVFFVAAFLPLWLCAQSQVISVKFNNMPLGKAMKVIGKKANLKIAYSKEFVDVDKLVSLSAKNERVDKVLDALFQNIDVAYSIKNGTIMLYRTNRQKKDAKTKPSPTYVANDAQPAVYGTIKDKNGEPLVGATISTLDQKVIAITDQEGQFSIKVDPGTVLKINYVGCEELKYTVRGDRTISLVMQEDATGLDEVVVVGYGTQKKINLTGAVSMIKGDDLENRPIANVTSGLQGMLPGVTIESSSGQPGAVPSIRVRGINTISSNTSPLILIDGVAGGDLNLLNPLDIESVSVLKDAASSAIYGARAANGVILITTKKGKRKENAHVSYSGYVGMQTPTALPKLVNGRQYMELYNESMAAAGFSKPYGEDAFQKYDSGEYPNEYSNTDWVHEIFKKNALQTSHAVSVRGGGDKSAYFLSYGYLNQDGLVVGDAFNSKRHNARINVNTEIGSRLKLNGTVSFVDYNRHISGFSGTGGVFRLAQRISPLLPIKWKQKNDAGQWEDTPYWSYGSVGNPLYVAYEGGSEKSKSRTLNAIIEANLKIVDGLYLNGQYAANYYFREIDEFSPTLLKFNADGEPSPDNKTMKNSVRQSHQDALTQSFQITSTFNKKFWKHDIGALLGFSQEWYDNSNLSGSRKNILVDDIYVLSMGTEDITNSGTKGQWALQSYFGRLNYAFDNKYLLEANIRIDGTSRFAKNNRWGYFPSFSVGWNFFREDFMRFLDSYMSMGKLRASWGELGNQNVGSTFYPYVTPIERREKAYPIGDTNNVGFEQRKLGNTNIKWETIRMLNVGLDLNFISNRLSLTFDWFKKENINALVKPIFPTIVGVVGSNNLPFENMGRIENKGWEFGATWRDHIGEVRYGLSFNISDSKNKITDLGNSEPSLGNHIRRVGDPINAYYGYLTDGLAQTSDFEGRNEDGKYINPKFVVPSAHKSIVQPGDIKYRDVSGPEGKPDGMIDEYDKVVFGEPFPHYTYAIKANIAWRGWDFSCYFQGVGKVNGYLSDEARHCFINDYSVPKVEHLNRWTPNNPNGTYPRLYQGQSHNLMFSNYWLEDASYLRLKNVQLGYTFPNKWVSKLGMNHVRAYFSADNLLTFTKYFGSYDPEVRETSGSIYPQVKTYVFGLSVNF
ncbi:SusC/RagA family TonB-linked outer membrane protein [Hoylesella buccalis]|uniref:SusC/RagA family TonB-linked outer membrane protein n=1 Tax=Hoylesella buccalis TaxID=28127 RepID=A0A2N6QRW3_9BACT|nr:TonB-dependent receptor [Hoylesella buccalis]PMC24633.1 SusC/RagA family TonB-linked outer membrane protein [Hoylesella buccalis]